MLGPRGRVEEVPLPETSLLALHDEPALTGQNEERLLVGLGVVEARLARLEDGDVESELLELDRSSTVLVLEVARRAPAVREPPFGVAHVHDEPALGDGCEA
jgi:hypothetical protein